MKILVLDHDALAAQLIKSRLEPAGHTVVAEASKERAIERLSAESFDVVLIDPAPLNSPRSMILGFRRAGIKYLYLFLMTGVAAPDAEMRSGTNDVILKPLDPPALLEKIDNAARLMALLRRIGDDSTDFPSGGGVIAKSAFNQLFLSALDRADRYAEHSHILLISVTNAREILQAGGAYAADFVAANLSKQLGLIRRQSDIIGQTDKYEYALLLQRPVDDVEPAEAANRFADSLSRCKSLVPPGMSAHLQISLLEVPAGALLVDYRVEVTA